MHPVLVVTHVMPSNSSKKYRKCTARCRGSGQMHPALQFARHYMQFTTVATPSIQMVANPLPSNTLQCRGEISMHVVRSRGRNAASDEVTRSYGSACPVRPRDGTNPPAA